MQRREKILAVLLGGFLVIGGGIYFVQNLLFAPINTRVARRNSLATRLEKADDEQLKIVKAQAKIRNWNGQSLPPDPVAAQRMYVAWLTDLAQSCGFASPKLTPDRRVSNKIYVGVRVTIDATANFQQLCNFVYQFRRTDLLHRIADLRIQGEDGSATAPLKVTVVAEGLSLKDATPRSSLFPLTEITAAVQPSDNRIVVGKADGFPAKGEFLVRLGGELVNVQGITDSTWTVVRGVDGTTAAAHSQGASVELVPIHPSMKNRKLEDFRALTSQNPFAKPEKPKPPETKKPDEVKSVVNLEDPAAKTTKLIATTAVGDERQICFYEPAPADKRTIVKEGSSFKVAGIDGKLESVEHSFILIRVKEETWRLELGKEIAAMKKIDGGPQAGAGKRMPIVAERPGEKKAPPAEKPAPPQTAPATLETATPSPVNTPPAIEEKTGPATSEKTAPSEPEPATPAVTVEPSAAPVDTDAPAAAEPAPAASPKQ